MTVLMIVAVSVVVWCGVVSVAAAIAFGRVVARANRDAQLQQAMFERHADTSRVYTAA